jgi:hypothetical protein
MPRFDEQTLFRKPSNSSSRYVGIRQWEESIYLEGMYHAATAILDAFVVKGMTTFREWKHQDTQFRRAERLHTNRTFVKPRRRLPTTPMASVSAVVVTWPA